jgi:hypothetical protein
MRIFPWIMGNKSTKVLLLKTGFAMTSVQCHVPNFRERPAHMISDPPFRGITE